MKQIILFIMGMVLVNASFAKEPQELDTIYANNTMNMALFFPSDIRQGIVGSENFVFTYNREKGQTLGLLKASKGAQSNLLVITTDGRVYSYIIRFSDTLEELNRFVTISESIGDEKSGRSMASPERDSKSTKTTEKITISVDSLTLAKGRYSKEFFEDSCASLLRRPERRNIVKQKNGMSMGIKNLIYYKDLVFMQLEVKNQSGIDFEMDTLEVIKVNGNNRRKASYQELALEPVHVYEMPDKVSHGNTARFVYILPKFTLGDNENLLLSLKELQGNRELVLRRKL